MQRVVAAAVFLLALGGDPTRLAASPVLLTFDVESDEDVHALGTLGFTEPATYFVTGEMADRHPQTVEALARTNTVGSHGYAHQDLTGLPPVERRKNLLLAKLVLERATGRPALWFRAPNLKSDAHVMATLKELGFRYDSSQGRWQEPIDLLELPISFAGDLLASDYDIFHRAGMSEPAALEWLERLHREKATTGRPLVILLHPRIIARRADTLRLFVARVRAEGGTFLTADAYVDRVRRTSPTRLGAWVALDREPVDPEQLAKDVTTAGLTDVFLMAKSTSGVRYFGAGRDQARDVFGEGVRALKKSGVRVHAWVPVALDQAVARRRSEWAMVAQNGRRSADWVSISHPEFRRWLRETIVELVTHYDVDGIHLDYLRYPGLDYDFTPPALDAFRNATGSAEAIRATLLSPAHYARWTSWRAQQVTQLTRELRDVVTRGRGGVSLSAALQARPAISRRWMEETGQDYEQLASFLDFVVVMAYFKEHGESVPWIPRVAFAARMKMGAKPLFVGVETYQHPGRWTYTTLELADALREASDGADGLALYQYLYLFGRGAPGWNMPQGSADLLRLVPMGGHRAASSVVLGAVALMISLLGAGVYLFGRQPRPDEGGRTSGDRLESGLDWREADAQISTGSVPGALAASVSAFLRQLGPQRIDRWRHAAVLEAVDVCPEPEGALDALEVVAGWRVLARRYLREARVQGHVAAIDGAFRLTSGGRRELLAAQRMGYDRDLWRCVEKRLHETVVIACPVCRTMHHGHWFWPSLECDRCGHGVSLEDGAALTILPPAVALNACEVA